MSSSVLPTIVTFGSIAGFAPAGFEYVGSISLALGAAPARGSNSVVRTMLSTSSSSLLDSGIVSFCGSSACFSRTSLTAEKAFLSKAASSATASNEPAFLT